MEVVWRGTELELHLYDARLRGGLSLRLQRAQRMGTLRFRCVDSRTGRIEWDLDEGWQRYNTRGAIGLWARFDDPGLTEN